MDVNNLSTQKGTLMDKSFITTSHREEIALMFKIVRFPKKLDSLKERGYLLDSTSHYLLWLTNKWNGTGSTCTACCARR
jgi:hypothetical protein